VVSRLSPRFSASKFQRTRLCATDFYFNSSLSKKERQREKERKKNEDKFIRFLNYSGLAKRTTHHAGGGAGEGEASAFVLALLAVLAAPPATAAGGRRLPAVVVVVVVLPLAPPPPPAPTPAAPAASSSPPALLNSQGLLQNGHLCCCSPPPPPAPASHLEMHWRWNACPHAPQTTGASSPGNLASGGQASNAALQMPQTSSPASQVQDATARQCLMETRKEEEAEEVEVVVAFSAIEFVFILRFLSSSCFCPSSASNSLFSQYQRAQANEYDCLFDFSRRELEQTRKNESGVRCPSTMLVRPMLCDEEESQWRRNKRIRIFFDVVSFFLFLSV